MDFLSEDGDVKGLFDERVRIHRRDVLSNITNKLGEVPGPHGQESGASDAGTGGGKEIVVQAVSKDVTGPRGEGRGKVVFKDFIGDSGEEARAAKFEDGEDGKAAMLSRIQKEFEELKEAHKKTLRARGKLIRAMEKEVSEMKQKMESRKKAEEESLRRQYDEKLQKRKEMYKKICKERILEYKRRLDEAYRAKALELRKRCEALKRIKELHKGRQSR
ncbi:hypothetical protein M970_010950 [Encephalitozoon cuniculi EcunIII-L]|uniref:Uncharacterized protein n=1 Tax=Encephalitozoon cuniculi TaxID=6035 RepID=M1K9T5_ENCCN|nr:hypothetical protein ECU01_1100 [Encephalitozoon cuniculi]KMV66765.1 hypothetical protein M970_010950 [Encephalitozoon cuniculi EcunIII-L]